MNILIFAAEVGETNTVHFPHDINELIWGSLAFFIVVGLLWWKAGPAIGRAWNGRIERIEGELGQAAEARGAAEASLAGLRARLADAETERGRILAEANATAVAVKAQLIERAHGEAADVAARAAADVEASRSQAAADLTAEVGSLTLGAAEAIVRSNLDADTQRSLVDGYITRIGASS
jgi:F-type H+-transporting ATPase subunit b